MPLDTGKSGRIAKTGKTRKPRGKKNAEARPTKAAATSKPPPAKSPKASRAGSPSSRIAEPEGRGLAALEGHLRAYALAFPETVEDSPWGDRAFKVRGKVFLFMSREAEPLTFSVKLPESVTAALALPFTAPTGYGLGKSGWVTVTVAAGKSAPPELFEEWIEESWRAIAPKRVAATRASI